MPADETPGLNTEDVLREIRWSCPAEAPRDGMSDALARLSGSIGRAWRAHLLEDPATAQLPAVLRDAFAGEAPRVEAMIVTGGFDRGRFVAIPVPPCVVPASFRFLSQDSTLELLRSVPDIPPVVWPGPSRGLSFVVDPHRRRWYSPVSSGSWDAISSGIEEWARTIRPLVLQEWALRSQALALVAPRLARCGNARRRCPTDAPAFLCGFSYPQSVPEARALASWTQAREHRSRDLAVTHSELWFCVPKNCLPAGSGLRFRLRSAFFQYSDEDDVVAAEETSCESDDFETPATDAGASRDEGAVLENDVEADASLELKDRDVACAGLEELSWGSPGISPTSIEFEQGTVRFGGAGRAWHLWDQALGGRVSARLGRLGAALKNSSRPPAHLLLGFPVAFRRMPANEMNAFSGFEFCLDVVGPDGGCRRSLAADTCELALYEPAEEPWAVL